LKAGSTTFSFPIAARWCAVGSSQNSPTIIHPHGPLDLVHPDAAQQEGGYPFSLALDDPQQESAANSSFYEIKSSGIVPEPGAVLKAPAEISFSWSDGHLEVTKHLKFNESYIVDVQTSVSLDGASLQYGVSWRGGFGDVTAYRAALQTQVFTSAAGKLNVLSAKNLGKSGQPGVREKVPGPFDFVGIEDLYFAAAFLPEIQPPPAYTPPEIFADWLDFSARNDRQRTEKSKPK